ncbi:hypothetical protein C8R47DRAFT_1073686 [Mycena vitilis]|nr:hypothetical protein C8R47DRAFT_1073686 [Mycena vitilis]
MHPTARPRPTVQRQFSYPDQAFFDQEQYRQAESLVGSLDVMGEARPRVASGSATHFVYEVNEGTPVRVFVLGTVASADEVRIRDPQAICEEPKAHQDASSNRLMLMPIPDAVPRVARLWGQDVAILLRVMDEEIASGTVIASQWTTEGGGIVLSQLPLATVFRWNSDTDSTKTINGMPTVGDVILADVTMHRVEEVVGGLTVKSYDMVAHTIEVVHPSRLRGFGLTAPQVELAVYEMELRGAMANAHIQNRTFELRAHWSVFNEQSNTGNGLLKNPAQQVIAALPIGDMVHFIVPRHCVGIAIVQRTEQNRLDEVNW